MPVVERIDVHAHYLPDFYRKALKETGHGKPDGMPAVPDWSEENHLELMENLGITKSILSISSPGTFLVRDDLDAAKVLTRQCNDFAAELIGRRPDQFGFWASLPLPDVPSSMDEIAHAFDELNADGITLHTNFHGIYLGDGKFEDIFTELNRRRARVFIHPTTPCVAACHSSEATSTVALPQYPNPTFEFMFDTARALINLFLSGTVDRYPDITFIIPHAGGALPPLIERVTLFSSAIPSSRELKLTSDLVKKAFKNQFFFDLAGMPFPDQIHGLLRYVDTTRLLYATDFPYTPEHIVASLTQTLDVEGGAIWSTEEMHKVLIGNAAKMLGRAT